MKKLILTLLNFFIVLTFLSAPISAHTRSDPSQIIFGGQCPVGLGGTGVAANHVNTGIGCVHTNPPELTTGIVDLAVKTGGAIAFLFLIMGAFHLVTSGGSPDHITHGKEMMTSAIFGLLLIVFSVVILQIIGVDILGLPGWQRGPGPNEIIVP